MCLVYNESSIFVQEKVGTRHLGGLVFPGGHVEEGESLRDSIIREIKEETGLTTEAVLNEKLVLSELQNFSDDEVIKKLTSLRGIGLWTAKMYLIFVLNRQNVLPVEDVAFLQSYK